MLYHRFEKVSHFVTFCDISKYHNVTLLNFVTFLGFSHVNRYVSFLVFLAKPKSRSKPDPNIKGKRSFVPKI